MNKKQNTATKSKSHKSKSGELRHGKFGELEGQDVDWRKNTLEDVVHKVRHLGRASGYMLKIDNTKFDSRYGFIVCGSHVFSFRATLVGDTVIQYVVGRAYARKLNHEMNANIHTKTHENMFSTCAKLDNNPDGQSFIPSAELNAADHVQIIAEYIFGVLVQDALLKATFTQLVNSIVIETAHPTTFHKLRIDGYLQNTYQQLNKVVDNLQHCNTTYTAEVVY